MSEDPTGGAVAPLSVETDLTVRVDGAELALSSTGERLLVDADATPGALSRRLGLAPVEIRADGALGAVCAELAAVDAAFLGGG